MGNPHLRIENRMLPAGPTVLDEVANAAFWVGVVTGIADEIDDIRDHISFADVKDNFEKAAKYGIYSKFIWFNDKKIDASKLVLKELLPLARKGLRKRGVVKKDIDRYLGVIQQRAKHQINGSTWMLKNYNDLMHKRSKADTLAVLTSDIIENQWQNKPVHTWKTPESDTLTEEAYSEMTIEKLMQTDLFTVQEDDVVELVVDIMAWRKVKCICVENKKSRLLGIVSKHNVSHLHMNNGNITVKDIMTRNPVIIHPNASIKDALQLMKEKKTSCLPVVEEGELIGMVSEADFSDYKK